MRGFVPWEPLVASLSEYQSFALPKQLPFALLPTRGLVTAGAQDMRVFQETFAGKNLFGYVKGNCRIITMQTFFLIFLYARNLIIHLQIFLALI